MQLRSLLLIMVLIGTSLGQPPPGDEPMHHPNMDAIRIWKLTEVLELNEDQVAGFLPMVQIHERKLREVQKELVALSREARDMHDKGEVSQKEVDAYIRKFEEKQAEIHKIKSDFIQDLPKHLTPEQQLLYLSFETRFRSELREYMKNERRGMRQPKNR